MLTHSLIQYLTLPATPPPPVALAAGVRFIHKARLYAIGSHGHTITVNAAGNAENTVKNIAFNYIVRLA
ncbi:Prophage tail fiber domain protein [Escherichia coli]|nr:hypothetical protein [Escherichia coli]SVF53573.1 Prophage tail fiber domain protein [Escherichia coli]